MSAFMTFAGSLASLASLRLLGGIILHGPLSGCRVSCPQQVAPLSPPPPLPARTGTRSQAPAASKAQPRQCSHVAARAHGWLRAATRRFQQREDTLLLPLSATLLRLLASPQSPLGGGSGSSGILMNRRCAARIRAAARQSGPGSPEFDKISPLIRTTTHRLLVSAHRWHTVCGVNGASALYPSVCRDGRTKNRFLSRNARRLGPQRWRKPPGAWHTCGT